MHTTVAHAAQSTRRCYTPRSATTDDAAGWSGSIPPMNPAARRWSGIVAGLAVGGCLTWNVSNVGAAADPLAAHYGVSIAAVGLLTTALFFTHLAVQLPSGRGADRFGAQSVALLAIAAGVLGNAILLVDAGFELALVG